MAKNTKVVAAYVPVLHKGYLQFFEHAKGSQFYIFGQDLLDEIDYLRKEIRAINPENMAPILQAAVDADVTVLDKKSLQKLAKENAAWIMPDDDVSHHIAETYLKKQKVSFYPVFLRWDRRNTSKQDAVQADRVISVEKFNKEMMARAHSESLRSTNIWRRVGAVIVRDDQAIFAGANKHLPTDYSIWIDGDPRSTANRGSDLDLTTDMHAEARLITHAAKQGIKLEGASMYVSTFPCPPCSKLIAESGISKCYYAAGYATLDGEDLLKAYDVELIHVESPELEGHKDSWVPYPEKPKKKKG